MIKKVIVSSGLRIRLNMGAAKAADRDAIEDTLLSENILTHISVKAVVVGQARMSPAPSVVATPFPP